MCLMFSDICKYKSTKIIIRDGLFDVEPLKQPNIMVSWYPMVSPIQTSKQIASSAKLRTGGSPPLPAKPRSTGLHVWGLRRRCVTAKYARRRSGGRSRRWKLGRFTTKKCCPFKMIYTYKSMRYIYIHRIYYEVMI